jgi:serine/threonine-protein kinase RIO1
MIKKELKEKIEKEVLFRETTDDENLIIDLCSDIILRHNSDNIDLEKDLYNLNVKVKNRDIEISSLKEELLNLKNKINERK